MKITIQLQSLLFEELKKFAAEQGISPEEAANEYLHGHLETVSGHPAVNLPLPGRIFSVDFERCSLVIEFVPDSSMDQEMICAESPPLRFTNRAGTNYSEWYGFSPEFCPSPSKKLKPKAPYVYSQPFPLY